MDRGAAIVSADLVRLERDGAVAELILDHADKLNTFDTALTDALGVAVADLSDDRSVRAVVVAGEGKAFSAGADIAEFSALPDGKAFLQGARRHALRGAAEESAGQPEVEAGLGLPGQLPVGMDL